MHDSLPALLTFFGAALMLVSWVYMIIISFKDDYAWGFMTVFIPPLGYLYGFAALGKAWEAEALGILGIVLILFGIS